MPIRFKRDTPRRRHFIREWRVAKGMTQAELAKLIGISEASVSRIEDGKQPYTQDTLEAISDILGEEPAYLITCDPRNIGPVGQLRRISPELRRQALEYIEFLRRNEPKE